MGDFNHELKLLHSDVRTYAQKNESRFNQIQQQVDALDLNGVTRHGAGPAGNSFQKMLDEDDGVSKLLRDKKGSVILNFSGQEAADLFERKTTLVTTGADFLGTTGVLPIDRIAGITAEARQRLKVRDLLTARPTTLQVVDFVKVLSPLSIASPVVEAAVKPENALTFASASERVKVIATWIPASRQILDDMAELRGFIEGALPYYVDLAEEQQMLTGDGTGENLHGLIPQATGFQTSLLNNSKGWNKIDILGRVVQQIATAKELDPTFVVLHPNDWWDIRLTKDSFGRYIFGDPQMASLGGTANVSVRANLFGLNVVATVNIAPGSFLVGSGDPAAAEIRDRLETQVEISTEHASFFVQNLIAIRCEKRLCLCVKRPASYISGSFTSSP